MMLHPPGGPAAAAEARPAPPRVAPAAAGDGSPHRPPAAAAAPPPPPLALLRPPDVHTFPERSIRTRSATAAAWMAGLDPTATATEAVYGGGSLAPLWLSGGGPAAVPAAHLCGGGGGGGGGSGGGGGGSVGRSGEPAVDDGYARFPSTAHVPAVVDGGLVCGTGVVVEARAGAAGTPTGGPPRTATRFCRWVYDAPTAHYLAAWALPTGGGVAMEASQPAAAAAGAAGGSVDGGGPARDRVTWVTSAFGRPTAVGGEVALRRRAVWVGPGKG